MEQTGFRLAHQGLPKVRYGLSAWFNVGMPSFTPGNASDLSLAFSPSNEPYVAFCDQANSNRSSVMKFNGSDWVYVGSPGFSGGGSSHYLSLAFNPSGKPYVAYVDEDSAHKAKLMKYDSVSTGINEISDGQLFLYPNPTSSYLIVDFNNVAEKISSLEIRDISGMKMIEIPTRENKISVDVENFPAGIYLVKLHTANSSYIRKFCKI